MSYVSGATTTIAAGAVTTTEILDGTVALADMANLTPPKLIGRGTASAGVPEALTPTNLYFGNSTVMARSGRTNTWSGGAYIASNDDIPFYQFATGGTVTLAAATVYLAKIPLPGSGTTVISVTNVLAWLNTKAASTLTHSYAGLLTSGGTLIGQSADESSANQNWSTTGAAGLKTHALVGGPFNVTPTGVNDFVYACLYIGTTAGTAPIFQATPSSAIPIGFLNLSNSAATSNFGTIAVADSATPFTGLTLSTITATGQVIWMGIS